MENEIKISPELKQKLAKAKPFDELPNGADYIKANEVIQVYLQNMEKQILGDIKDKIGFSMKQNYAINIDEELLKLWIEQAARIERMTEEEEAVYKQQYKYAKLEKELQEMKKRCEALTAQLEEISKIVQSR